MYTNPNQLIEALNKLPHQIREAELAYLEAQKEEEKAKLEYDVAFGTALIEADRPNATEKKSVATIVSQYHRVALIETQYNTQMKEAELNYLKDRFTALRRISNIEETLIKSQLTGV